MKYLILLLLAGCSMHYRQDPPKFAYNQPVHVYDDFYKGVEGTIDSYRCCLVRLANGDIVKSYCYKVYVNERTTVEVSEQELTK
jgi:hypothetical protein